MKITSIRIKTLHTDNHLLAIAAVAFDDLIAIKDIRIERHNGELVVIMPGKRLKNGAFKSFAHPINEQARLVIERLLIGAYHHCEEGDIDKMYFRINDDTAFDDQSIEDFDITYVRRYGEAA